jgi:hypothetical protein
MSKPNVQGTGKTQETGTGIYYGPVLIILALLICWLLAANWDRLPQVIASAVAALP